MALKGNKGEWSEVYVFLKLLADGRLYAADENLDAIPNVYFPIIKILRKEVAGNRDFVVNGDVNIEVYDGTTDTLIVSIPVADFVNNSIALLKDLKKAKGAKLSFPEIETFLKTIQVSSVAALKKDKADIRVIVHDLNTGLKPKLGFSIKSMLGKDSTLFNPGPGTNFVYKLSNVPPSFDFNNFNIATYQQSKIKGSKSKLAIRITELEKLGINLSFEKIHSENLQLNLELIDSQLPLILAYITYYKYKTGVSKLTNLITAAITNNPLNFNLTKGHPFYDVKIKSFLTESALGMTPETVWTGIYDATGGIIIVKKTGDLVCYHIYNKNEFESYLINNTRLDQASTGEDALKPGFARTVKGTKKYQFGWVYEEHGDLFLKLNLQVRFK